MPTVYDGIEMNLEAPIELQTGDVVRNCKFGIAPTFTPRPEKQPLGLLKIGPGVRDVRIEDTELTGFTTSLWKLLRMRGAWWVWPLRGIQVHDGWNIDIRNVTIAGMPGEAISTQDVTGLNIDGLFIRDCWGGIGIDWPRIRPNASINIRRVLSANLRAITSDLVAFGESTVDPGGYVGGNHFAGGGGIGFQLTDFYTMGDGKGVKITDAQDVKLQRIHTSQLWLGGAGWNLPNPPYNYMGPTESHSYVAMDCVLGLRDVPITKTKTSGWTPLFISYPFTTPVEVTRSTIYAPMPGPLWADWWKDTDGNPIPAPDFTRHGVIQVSSKGSLKLSNSRIVDLWPDEPEPIRYVEEGSSLEEFNVTQERLKLLWTAP